MTFPVVGSNIPSAYQISNSLRFNDNDSPQLSRTPDAGNRKTFTLSFWLKRGNLGTNNPTVISSGTNSSNDTRFAIRTDNGFIVRGMEGGGSVMNLQSSALFRDVSAWYHFVLAFDTTQSTASNRVKIYQNGVQITDFGTEDYPTQNRDLFFNHSSSTEKIGVLSYSNANYWDGYMAEFQSVDGQALSPTDFGEFDEDSGVWKPKQYAGTYGTNGFYLKFNNTGNMGEDSSGNDNTFTPTNLSGTTDVTTDTPTNNFATFTPLNGYNQTLTEGNTRITASTGSSASGLSTIAPTSGKWYIEYHNSRQQNSQLGVYSLNDYTHGNDTYNFPVGKSAAITIEAGANYSIDWDEDATGGTLLQNSTNLNEAKYGMAIDIDNGNVYFSANGNWYSSVSGAFDKTNFSDATAVFSALPTTGDVPIAIMCRGSYDVGSGFGRMNFGNPPSDYSISSGNTDENGYGNFEYAPPSGYLALCTQNLATELSPTIDDGSQYFNTKLYTGTGSATSITGVGFQPDFTWIKQRNNANNHKLMNSTAGSTKFLVSANTDAEGTDAQGITSFDSDGFSLGTSGSYNGSGGSYVSWNWLANGGTTSSNTDGSITSTVQANTTAGFSIITYTGTGSNATVGHGLGKSLDMVLVKNRSVSGRGWVVWHNALAGNEALELNTTDAKITSATSWNSTVPTSSVFSVGTRVGTNESSATFVAYCFAEIEGYSKFGSGTGSGTASTNFIYTGFKPSWVMIKRTDSTDSWAIFDNKRPSYNVTPNRLFADLSNAESTSSSNQIDMVSNGFVARGTSTTWNASGSSFIYMAFAENPFVTSGAVPVTAR